LSCASRQPIVDLQAGQIGTNEYVVVMIPDSVVPVLKHVAATEQAMDAGGIGPG
jgi:hypothetical protein